MIAKSILRRTIRVAKSLDAPQIQAIYAPVVRETAISFEEEPPSIAEMAGRIDGALPTYPYLVCEDDGQVVGYAYSSAHRARAAYRWSVDVTVYVAAAARGTGVGRALYTPLLNILRRQRIHGAFAGIALPNANSVGLHEALGFRPIGIYKDVGFKFNAWHDVGWWRLSLAEGTPGGDPIPFSDLSDDLDQLLGEVASPVA